MKILRVERLIDEGGFSSTEEWKTIESQITQAIKTIEWPPDSGSFTLYPESGKKRGQGNGVKPIKDACMLHLKSNQWTLEQKLTDIDTGAIDAAYQAEKGLFCVEWETGNVSLKTHTRPVNHLCDSFSTHTSTPRPMPLPNYPFQPSSVNTSHVTFVSAAQ